MRCHVVHRTVYEYSLPVTESHHAARMRPLGLPHQTCSAFALRIAPEPAALKTEHDYFGNAVCFFRIEETHSRLEVEASSRVEVTRVEPSSFEDSPAWENVVRRMAEPGFQEAAEAYELAFDSPLIHASRALADYARRSFGPGTPILAGASSLIHRIHEDFKYDAVATTVSTPLEEVLESRRGVCQDFAHVAIGCLRSIGLPARYVSGYVRTHPPEGKERLVGADASHAWLSVYCPGAGWVDFDPTNDLVPTDEHVTVAYGRDFGDVSPILGILSGGGEHSVAVGVDVRV